MTSRLLCWLCRAVRFCSNARTTLATPTAAHAIPAAKHSVAQKQLGPGTGTGQATTTLTAPWWTTLPWRREEFSAEEKKVNKAQPVCSIPGHTETVAPASIVLSEKANNDRHHQEVVTRPVWHPRVHPNRLKQPTSAHTFFSHNPNPGLPAYPLVPSDRRRNPGRKKQPQPDLPQPVP